MVYSRVEFSQARGQFSGRPRDLRHQRIDRLNLLGNPVEGAASFCDEGHTLTDMLVRGGNERLDFAGSLGRALLKCRLLLGLGIFGRSYRLTSQVEMLYVLAVPAPPRILGGINQLANGRVKPLAKPYIEFNRSKSICVGIQVLPPCWSKFPSAPPKRVRPVWSFRRVMYVRSEVRHGNLLAYLLDLGRPHGFHSDALKAFLLAVSRATSQSSQPACRLKPLNVRGRPVAIRTKRWPGLHFKRSMQISCRLD